MGLLRKTASLSTLGAVKYTSRREAQTKEAIANARLARTQNEELAANAKPAKAQAAAAQNAQWDEILAAFQAGEVKWEDLGRMQKLTMPIAYQLKCKAAQRRLAPTEPVVEVVPEPVVPVIVPVPEPVVTPVVLVAEPVASAAELVAPAELKASDLSFGQKVTADRVIMQARKAGVKLSKPEAYAYVLAGHKTYADVIATTN
jgi:hypothetical protein